MKNDLQDYLKVTFHPEIPALEITWIKPATPALIHQAYEAALAEMIR